MSNRRRMVMAWIGTFAVLALAAPAAACDCLPPGAPGEELQQADAVFTGRVVGIRRAGGPNSHQLRVDLTVRRSWKGVAVEQMSVITENSGAACGFDFHSGTEYLVYALWNRESGDFECSLCSRTAPVSRAQEDLHAFGAPVYAVPPEREEQVRLVLLEEQARERQREEQARLDRRARHYQQIFWLLAGLVALLGAIATALVVRSLNRSRNPQIVAAGDAAPPRR